MKKQFLLASILTAALVAGFASAPAFAMDDMKKGGMSKMSSDNKMSSEKMQKSGKMNNMSSSNGMKKSHKSSKDKMNDGMSK
ncbi:MAG TPA: hypothetical protein VFX37_00740 [Pseudolabrys sp.]|nr:hypothetical protein [Pseudolabrys sp.]